MEEDKDEGALGSARRKGGELSGSSSVRDSGFTWMGRGWAARQRNDVVGAAVTEAEARAGGRLEPSWRGTPRTGLAGSSRAGRAAGAPRRSWVRAVAMGAAARREAVGELWSESRGVVDWTAGDGAVLGSVVSLPGLAGDLCTVLSERATRALGGREIPGRSRRWRSPTASMRTRCAVAMLGGRCFCAGRRDEEEARSGIVYRGEALFSSTQPQTTGRPISARSSSDKSARAEQVSNHASRLAQTGGSQSASASTVVGDAELSLCAALRTAFAPACTAIGAGLTWCPRWQSPRRACLHLALPSFSKRMPIAVRRALSHTAAKPG